MGQRGQGAVEHVAVLALVAVLLGGVASLAPGAVRAVRAADPRPAAADALQPGPHDDVPGTPEEHARTRTPRPPAGDQCSSSPDRAGSLYDFSFACYGHDICWQLGQLGGATTTLGQCNGHFLDAMREHCDRRHGAGSSRAGRCRAAALTYYGAVHGAAIAKAKADCPGVVRREPHRPWRWPGMCVPSVQR